MPPDADVSPNQPVCEIMEEDDAGVEAAYTAQVRTLAGSNVVNIPVNAGDTIMDVRQYLSESPETCYVTHYVLRHEGVEVNDFTEIAALIQVFYTCPGCVERCWCGWMCSCMELCMLACMILCMYQ